MKELNIILKPDFDLLRLYIPNASENRLQEFHKHLLNIKDFDIMFYDLLNKYSLLDRFSEVYYFAGEYCMRIDNLKTGRDFDHDKNINGYNVQFNELREYIYTSTPREIVFDNNNGQKLKIDNKILIQEILIAIDKIKEPSVKPISINSQHDTFRRMFLQRTRPLYDFMKKRNNQTKQKHRFICDLLTLVGFDWNGTKDPVNHLKRKYKE